MNNIVDTICYTIASSLKDKLNKLGQDRYNLNLVKNIYDYELTQIPLDYYPILTVYRRDEYIDNIYNPKSDLSLVIKYSMVYPTTKSLNSLNHIIATEIKRNLRYFKTELNIFVAEDRPVRIVYPPAQLFENQAILTTLELYLTVESGVWDN